MINIEEDLRIDRQTLRGETFIAKAGLIMPMPAMIEFMNSYRAYMKYSNRSLDLVHDIDRMIRDLEGGSSAKGVFIESAADPEVKFRVEFLPATNNRGPVLFYPFTRASFHTIPYGNAREVRCYEGDMAYIPFVEDLEVAHCLELASTRPTQNWMKQIMAEVKSAFSEYRPGKDDEYWRERTGIWMYTKV